MVQIDTLKKTIELNIQFLLLQKKNKEALKSYKKRRNKRKIKVINDDEPTVYIKNFVRIRFESDVDLPLCKTFNIFDMTIVTASVLEKKQ